MLVLLLEAQEISIGMQESVTVSRLLAWAVPIIYSKASYDL